MSMPTSEEVEAKIERLRARVAQIRAENPAPEKPEKVWSTIPLPSTEAEADEYIEKQIKEYHQIVIHDYGQNLIFDTSDAENDCLAAFVRHIANLYDTGAPEDRIQSDVTKIWSTFLKVAKTVEVGKHWELEDLGGPRFSNLDPMRRFVRGPSRVMNGRAHLDLEYLLNESPQKDGRVGFTEEHDETWTKEDRADYQKTSPWWNIRLDCLPRAVKALSAEVPNDEMLLWDSVPDEDPDYGPLRNMLGREISTPPEGGMYGNIEEWRRIHAYVACLFEYDRNGGYKRVMWPLRNAVKIFRDALEEERGFKAGLGKQPDVAVLSTVMPVWIECASFSFLSEIDDFKQYKDGTSQKVRVAPGPLATKALKDSKGFVTKKRWNYWKERCGEVYTAAHENYQTTLKVEKKGFKFWKKSSGSTLPKVGQDLAEDVEGAHGRWETKGNLLAVHKFMELTEKGKEEREKEYKAFEKEYNKKNP